MARLVAEVWVIICLYAGALALVMALPGSPDLWADVLAISGTVVIFLCLGLLFAGAAVFMLAGGIRPDFRSVFLRRNVDFSDILFALFVALSFCNQAFFAPGHMVGGLTLAIEQAAWFVVPGQRAFSLLVHSCTMDGGRIFSAAFTWVLALIWFGFALTRLKISARLLRAARRLRPDASAGLVSAILLGLSAAAGIQLFYSGSGIFRLPCSAVAGIAGALVAGLAPLLLVYVIIAALTGVISGEEN